MCKAIENNPANVGHSTFRGLIDISEFAQSEDIPNQVYISWQVFELCVRPRQIEKATSLKISLELLLTILRWELRTQNSKEPGERCLFLTQVPGPKSCLITLRIVTVKGEAKGGHLPVAVVAADELIEGSFFFADK